MPKLASAAEISEHVPINNTSSKDTENLQSESLLKHSNLHPLLPILDTGKRPRINSNIKGIIKTKTESFAKDEDEVLILHAKVLLDLIPRYSFTNLAQGFDIFLLLFASSDNC